jgi:RNA polymerase sigma-70 factor (ECF subfamily)
MTAESFRDMSDSALVVVIGRWEQDALAEAYRRHSGAVLALARRVLGDGARGEEVVQEVFTRLWNNPERFDPERGSLRAYLLAQSHGRAVDLLRADSCRRQREVRDSQRAVVADYDLEREVADVIVAEQVREAVGRLRTEERAAIELAYFGGHTYREVARLLGQPEGTVKSQIRIGMVRLRDNLIEAGIDIP